MTRRRTIHPSRQQRDERGTAAIELTWLAPLLLVMMLFIVGLARMANARQEVEAVAADAARAASLERITTRSDAAARDAARRSLGAVGVSCTNLDVDVDLTSYRPGGRVTVTIACTAKLGDVAVAGFPGARTFTATSTVPIETYRSG